MSSQKRILIVDGNAKLRQTLVMHFKLCTTYVVGLAAHGSDALEQIKQQRFDLVRRCKAPDDDGNDTRIDLDQCSWAQFVEDFEMEAG